MRINWELTKTSGISKDAKIQNMKWEPWLAKRNSVSGRGGVDGWGLFSLKTEIKGSKFLGFAI